MQPHQQRVVDEYNELETKWQALTELLTDQPRIERLNIPADELARLRRQHTYMRLYRDVLSERIAGFIADEVS